MIGWFASTSAVSPVINGSIECSPIPLEFPRGAFFRCECSVRNVVYRSLSDANFCAFVAYRSCVSIIHRLRAIFDMIYEPPFERSSHFLLAPFGKNYLIFAICRFRKKSTVLRAFSCQSLSRYSIDCFSFSTYVAFAVRVAHVLQSVASFFD